MYSAGRAVPSLSPTLSSKKTTTKKQKTKKQSEDDDWEYGYGAGSDPDPSITWRHNKKTGYSEYYNHKTGEHWEGYNIA